MLTLFWDAQGPVLEQWQEGETTINNVDCSEILWYELKPAAGIKCQGSLPKNVLVFQ
jgi:hypothetical protein